MDWVAAFSPMINSFVDDLCDKLPIYMRYCISLQIHYRVAPKSKPLTNFRKIVLEPANNIKFFSSN